MPHKHDHLTERIADAFRHMEHRISSGWASQHHCFEAGYRAGYMAGVADGSPERTIGAAGGQAGGVPPGTGLPARDEGER